MRKDQTFTHSKHITNAIEEIEILQWISDVYNWLALNTKYRWIINYKCGINIPMLYVNKRRLGEFISLILQCMYVLTSLDSR